MSFGVYGRNRVKGWQLVEMVETRKETNKTLENMDASIYSSYLIIEHTESKDEIIERGEFETPKIKRKSRN